MIFCSSYDPIYLLLPVIGFIIGLFGTMLGGGGGFFFLPILTLLVGAPAQVAVATSLTATLPIGIVGTWGHYRHGNVSFSAGGVFVLAGFVGAVLGTLLTRSLTSGQLKLAFGVYSLLIALNMLVGAVRYRQKREGLSKRSVALRGSFFGVFAGAISGVFGTSGTAPVLAGLFSMRIPLKTVVGTSLMVVLVNSLVAAGTHFLLGKIDLTLVAFLTPGSVLGALAGTRWLAKSKVERSEGKIRYLYALVVACIGVLMIVNR